MRKILFLVLSNVVLHLLIINTPSTYVFDEVHYVQAANSIILNGPNLRPEHTPLSQLIIAAGIMLFGNNPLGWRVFSVVFGALTVLVLYVFIKGAFGDERVAFASSFLLSFENMFFTFSLLALLDVYFIFFMVLSFYLFLKNRFMLSAAAFALSAACKVTALFALPIFPAFFIFRDFSTPVKGWLRSVRFVNLIVWFGTLAASFLGFLYVFDQVYAGLDFAAFRTVFFPSGQTGFLSVERQYFSDPFTHLAHIFEAHTGMGWPQTSEPQPWLWLTHSQNYYLGTLSLLGVQFFEGYNPVITGLVFVSVPVTLYNFLRDREKLSFFSFVWFCVGYFAWIPLYFIFARPLYHFYILMAVPAVCVSNSVFFRGKWPLLEGYLLVALAYFMFLQYPLRAVNL